ncbi:hypothetical protein [Thermoactinomyces sp. DSM 45892]|uniref:hypothetical protein n=1 Tax=Thermoactinomyces sp. DSM 45892 TaxID=1882753 RepID=UPI000897BE74|nr:hypothetical protein [Thermoactinomyces sp. DSM 45892]SDY39367.1 hypothetical protein SAMN05444416_104135 [Thermoactinomyces sp. DSM 45892]
MKATQLAFPIIHIEENLVFTIDGKVYAYYQLPRMGFNTQVTASEWGQLLHNDFHVLILPQMETIEEMPNFAMKPDDPAFLHKVNQIIKDKNISSTEKQIYLGFALESHPVETVKKKRSKWKHFRRYLESTSGLRAYDILDEEFTWYFQREQEMYQQHLESFSVKKASVYHLQYMVKHCHDRGIGLPELNPVWKPKQEKRKKDGQVVICPNQRDIQLLVQSEYEVHAQEMTVRRFHNGAVREGYVRFLYLTYLSEGFSVADYRSLFQWLPIPVDLSIRGRIIPPEVAMQFLTNGKEGLIASGQNGPLVVWKSVSEMQKGPFPLFDCTFCFGLYASTKEELDQNTQVLTQFIKEKGLELTTPVGEQFFSFYESLPGSQGFMGDYAQRWDPAMIAETVMNTSGPKPFLSLDELASSLEIPWSPSERSEDESTILVTMEMEVGQPGLDIELPANLPIYEVIRLLQPMMDGHIAPDEPCVLEIKAPTGNWVEMDEGHYFHECSIMDGAYLRVVSKQQKIEYRDMLVRLGHLPPEKVKQLFEEWYKNEVIRGGGEL